MTQDVRADHHLIAAEDVSTVITDMSIIEARVTIGGVDRVQGARLSLLLRSRLSLPDSR